MTKREISIEKLKHGDVICLITVGCDDNWIAERVSLIKDNKNGYAAFAPHHPTGPHSIIAEADSLEELLLCMAVAHPDMKLMCADEKAYNGVPLQEFSRALRVNLMRDDKCTLYEVSA